MTNKPPTYHLVSDPTVGVSREEAYQAWFEAAIPYLKGLAASYMGYTTYAMFVRYLFEQTGIRTNRPLQKWPGEILGMVLDECARRGWPALSSMVVDQKYGICGTGFGAYYVGIMDEPTNDEEREELAAHLRVNCYRKYALDVPADAVKFHTPIRHAWLAKQHV
jgi:hypothetical protein